MDPIYVSIDVIVINDFAETTGGAAQVALASAFGLAASGHRVTIFSAVPPAAAVPTHPNLSLVVTGQHEIAQDPNDCGQWYRAYGIREPAGCCG